MRQTKMDNISFICFLTVFGLPMTGSQMYPFRTTVDPELRLQHNKCREMCGNQFYDCKIGKCESGDYGSDEGYGPCIDLCDDHFYSCVHDCAVKYTPTVPTTTTSTKPTGIYVNPPNRQSAQEFSEYQSRVLNGQETGTYLPANAISANKDQVNAQPNSDFLNSFTLTPYSFTGSR